MLFAGLLMVAQCFVIRRVCSGSLGRGGIVASYCRLLARGYCVGSGEQRFPARFCQFGSYIRADQPFRSFWFLIFASRHTRAQSAV